MSDIEAVVRRVTADELDPHRSWTSQSGLPFPQADQAPPTRFHPSELPDPQKAVDAGLLPVAIPAHLIDDTYVTQPPTSNIPVDSPTRGAADPGYAASQATSVGANLAGAQALTQLQGSPESRDAASAPETAGTVAFVPGDSTPAA